MKIETIDGVIVIKGELTRSAIRIERYNHDQLMISLAARDEDGTMRIESVIVDASALVDLEPVDQD